MSKKVLKKIQMLFPYFILVMLGGCAMSNSELSEDVEFSSCVISKKVFEEEILLQPKLQPLFARHYSYFYFDADRQCYFQRWKMPRVFRGMTTEDSSGEDSVRIAFPYESQIGKRSHFSSGELAGIEVLVRPIKANANFEYRRGFNASGPAARIGIPTGQFFKGLVVYRENSSVPNFPGRVLLRENAKDFVVFLELKKNDSDVSEANVERIAVFSHIDERFEIHFRLGPAQLDRVNEINANIKNVIGSFIIKK